MSYDSTNSDNYLIDINDDVRQNFWNAIWDLKNIQIPSNTITKARVCCANKIWKIMTML